MKILTKATEMQQACRELRLPAPSGGMPCQGVRLGFVPTMGALHVGHLSLVEAARSACNAVAVSIFVNPLQFGAGEDYERYPRTFDQDCRMLQAAGVDLLFAPGADEMYPQGATTFVEVAGTSDRLDGFSRPGHFRGVATVVAKLFGVVGADIAFFGQKDAAQLAVLRAMARDLFLPVRLVACPTIREADGLAVSSRNRYLSPEERVRAVLLSQALKAGQTLAKQGETDAQRIRCAILDILTREARIRIDYVAVVDPASLQAIESVSRGALVAVAAWVGGTRLIDNFVVDEAEDTL